MYCNQFSFSFVVPQCGEVETLFVATTPGTYRLHYGWAAQQWCEEIEVARPDTPLVIQGGWFNERARVLGHFTAPDGSKLTVDGISDFLLTLSPAAC